MEITVGELLNLGSVIEKLGDLKTSTILAYKIARISRKLQEEIAIAEEKRTELIMPYVKKDEEGNPVIHDGIYETIPETQSELAGKLGEFFSTKISIEVSKLTLEEISKIDLTPRQIEFLFPIIDDSEEDEKKGDE